MKLKLFVASLLAAASFGALADNQTVDLTGLTSSHIASVADDGLFFGGKDVISFTGLAAGTYNVVLDLSGQFLSFGAASNFNGQALNLYGGVGKVRFADIEYNGQSPFVLELFGTVSNAARANYTGNISVSAVPEPETYGMLLAGLGLVGFAARRKAKKAA